MGRNTYPARGPRTSLVADREVRQALRGSMPKAFGIYRILDFDSNEAMTDPLYEMFPQPQETGNGDVLPVYSKALVRNPLSITLLSQKVIASQMARGRMGSINLGKARAMIEHDVDCAGRQEPMKVDIGDVHVYQDKLVYADLLNYELDDEVLAIQGVMASLGLKGVSRHEMRVPHLTLAEARKGHKFSAIEQDQIVADLPLALPTSVVVEPWVTSPYDVFDASAAA